MLGVNNYGRYEYYYELKMWLELRRACIIKKRRLNETHTELTYLQAKFGFTIIQQYAKISMTDTHTDKQTKAYQATEKR